MSAESQHKRIGVIGAGAWGTALAAMLAADGTPVTIWARSRAVADAINAEHANPRYLPGIALPKALHATTALAELVDLPIVLAAVPAQYLGAVLHGLPASPTLGDLVLCAKGIEAASGRLTSAVARGALAISAPQARLAVLSGPTFAHEVARGLPTAVTLACEGGAAQWQRLAPALARASFRPYYSEDIIGAEIGGAVKNVLAIACGVVAGLGLGENARAALIARGFAEMQRFGVALGARGETLAGLSGLGDLALTAASPASRNFALGAALGKGASCEQALAGKASIAEGAATAPVLAALARQKGVAMPIVEAVCRLLEGVAPARDIVAGLLARPLVAEHDAIGWVETRGGLG